jgi:quercetin dioxygenase-like cupin family protein
MSEGQMPSSPTAITGMVGYQDGSIVSRSLMKSSSGSVTLFAFDAGQALSEHTAPFDALIQVLDGAAAVTIGGTEHNVVTGQLIFLPANVPHAVRADERFVMMLTMLRDAAEK